MIDLTSDDVTRGPTNTEYERLGLSALINLSDGHARCPLTASQRAIVAQLPKDFEDASGQSQDALEAAFADAFFRLARQESVRSCRPPVLFSYSASNAIQIVANYLTARGGPVVLIEPCFDNIPRLLARERNEVIPVSEGVLSDPELAWKVVPPGASALWLVMPNNPTGLIVSAGALRILAAVCRSRNCVLVCDFCFRFFSDEFLSWDQYETLIESGVSFVAIEDTGKTWSTLDMKVGMFVASPELHRPLHARNEDLLLNVSPFHLLVLTRFIEDSLECGLAESVRGIIEANRAVALRLCEHPQISRGSGTTSNVPFEWFLAGQRLEARRSGTPSARGV